MTEADYQWLLMNRPLMYSSTRTTPEQGYKIFEIYNRISKQPMNYTTCGSCVRTVVTKLRQEFENYKPTQA